MYTKTKNIIAVLLERYLRASKLHSYTLPPKLRVECFSKFPTGMKTTSILHMDMILHLHGERTEKVRKGQRWSRHAWFLLHSFVRKHQTSVRPRITSEITLASIAEKSRLSWLQKLLGGFGMPAYFGKCNREVPTAQRMPRG